MPPQHGAYAPVLDETFSELPLTLTRKETAQLLRKTPEYVSELVASGELVAFQRRVKRGSPMLIPAASVRRYLERICR